MKIKKFRAENMQDALKQVKKEMGRDAVILSTKSVVNGEGVRGLFNRPVVEITAATDNEYMGKKAALMQPYVKNEASGRTHGAIPADIILKEIAELKRMIQKENAAKKIERYDNLARLYKVMLCNGMDEGFASQAIEELSDKISEEDIKDYEKVKGMMKFALEKSLKVKSKTVSPHRGCSSIALIGPTGVGKTTTIAKLAAYFTVRKRMDVGLITLDTYRIAAVEQLKIYSKILGIPLKVVTSKDELKKALRYYKDKDTVLIDTAGRSHKNKGKMDELASFFDMDIPICKHLVLSATTGNSAMIETIRQFIKCRPDTFIFSKIDEGTCFGNLINSCLQFSLPVSYLTTGQAVPDDIELATRGRIVKLALEDGGCSVFDTRYSLN